MPLGPSSCHVSVVVVCPATNSKLRNKTVSTMAGLALRWGVRECPGTKHECAGRKLALSLRQAHPSPFVSRAYAR